MFAWTEDDAAECINIIIQIIYIKGTTQICVALISI